MGLLLPGATTASGSPQSHEVKAAPAEPDAKSDTVGRAVTNPVGLKTPSDTAFDPATAPNVRLLPPLAQPGEHSRQ